VEIVLLVLLALAIPVCAIWGFALAWKLRGQALLLERRLAFVEAQLRQAAPPPAPSVGAAQQEIVEEATPAPVEAEPAPERLETSDPVEPAADEPFRPTPRIPPSPILEPTPPVAAAASSPPSRGFEETLGTRWAVWVGGVALALGGVFLVRYSVEQGLLGPGARVTAGVFFALALIAAGEWMRRREIASPIAVIPSAHVPSVLTAAGTSTAFATIYAAYALYGMIGPGLAFALLGLIAVATMVASALHGPALAGLGLVAALGSPLLVQSDKPQAWPLVLYLSFVVLAAYGVARLRLWRWLALAAAIGALVWTFPIAWIDAADVLPTMAHLVIQTALAGVFLVADPHRGTADEDAKVDGLASGVLLGLSILAILANASVHAGSGRPLFGAVMILVLLGLAVRFAAAAPAAAWAVLVALGTLALWPVTSEIAGEQRTVLPGFFGDAHRPQALATYLGFALTFSGVIAAASLWRLSRGRGLPLPTAAWFAGAATAGPLLALAIAYWRVTAFDRSTPFALVAGALALGFAVAAVWLRRQEGETLDPVRLALGATASAAVAALALGLTFALDKGMLTVAFALAALGAAWVADRVGIPALRYAVGAIGVVVLGRLAWDPTIGDDPGRTPIFNWLLWGYGVPAIAFFLASRLLEKSGRDRVVRLVESLSIVFATFLVFFEIRHWVQGGDPLAATSDHLEIGLIAVASLAFSLVMVRAQARRPDIVYHVASLIFGAATLLIAGFGLALAVNPLWSGEPVIGGRVFNSLLLAYLLPALLAGLLALSARGVRPREYVWSAAALALGLQLLYTILAIRRIFQGPTIDAALSTSQGEWWSYSLALLLIGIVLLGLGFLRDNRLLRLLSAGYIIAAVLKVFVIDLSNLEGVVRALSFIGLGLALVGIGLAYQKLLSRSAPSPSP
jgi:uncharacterized membrane protein